MSKNKTGSRGGDWQIWASSALVGLTLLVILLFLLQQFGEVS